jgi:glycosyltransferase involved in cell wall biosynthesis
LYKIALVSAAYPPYTFGGIDIQTYDLAHGLSNNGLDVTVFCGLSKKKEIIRENENLSIYRLPFFDFYPRVLWFQLMNQGLFRKEFKNFDLIHSQNTSGSIYSFFRNKIKTPWIVSFHDHQLRRLSLLLKINPLNLSLGDLTYYSMGYPLFEYLSNLEVKNADHYIICGYSGFKDFYNYNKIKQEKTTVIPNGVNPDKLENLAKLFEEKDSLIEPSNSFRLFTSGRLYTSKGIQYLIRAMPKVIRANPDVSLEIYGKGPLLPKLLALINDLKLEKKVFCRGHVEYEELMYKLKTCDLTVYPSLNEVGASLSVMEAMAFGKAVVAFDYPFTREILDHSDTGYLVKPKNVDELSDAVCLLIGDKKIRERIGENARLKILKKHNWNDVIKKYIDVYDKVISEHKDNSK